MSLARGRRGAARDGLQVAAEINVTSLIDIAFTLLVIFIITAPILQGGVEVRLPQAQVQAVTAQDEPFIVTVLADGSIVIGETTIPREEFEDIFLQFYEIASPSAVYIRADAGALYGQVAPVFAIAFRVAAADGVSVALIMEPEEPSR